MKEARKYVKLCDKFNERIEKVGGQEFIERFIEDKFEEVRAEHLPHLSITYPFFNKIKERFDDNAAGFTGIHRLKFVLEGALDLIRLIEDEFDNETVKSIMQDIMKYYVKQTEGLEVEVNKDFIDYEKQSLCKKEFLVTILRNVHDEMNNYVDRTMIDINNQKEENEWTGEYVHELETVYHEVYSLSLAQYMTIQTIELFNEYLEGAENDLMEECETNEQ